MTIDFQDVFERCMMETAYLARHAAEQASDEARATTEERTFSNQYVGRFSQLRIRPSDRSLLFSFIREGAHLTESRILPLLEGRGEYTAESVTWEINTSAPLPFPTPAWPTADETTSSESSETLSEDEEEDKTLGVYGLFEDVLTAYALWRWLGGKMPDAAALYATKWNDGIESVKKILCASRLQKPVKTHSCHRREPPCHLPPL